MNAKLRAKAAGLPFDIDHEFVEKKLPLGCPVTGEAFEQKSVSDGRPAPTSASLDRFIPEKGYTKENTWVISHKANMIKSNGVPLDVLRVVSWMYIAQHFQRSLTQSEFVRLHKMLITRILKLVSHTLDEQELNRASV